jgi:hypothetical protein
MFLLNGYKYKEITMIKHIVMWRLKDEAAGATKEVNALKLKDALESLTDKIQSLKAAEVGINFNPSPAAFDVVLYSEFDDEEGLQAYQNHPEHLKIVDFVGEIRTDRAVVDYMS